MDSFKENKKLINNVINNNNGNEKESVCIDGIPFNCEMSIPNILNLQLHMNNEAHENTPLNNDVKKKVIYDPTSMYYDMSGDKMMFIFNHYEYKRSKMLMDPPEKRDGTHYDVESLNDSFGKVGFDVKTYNDLTHREIFDVLDVISLMDHERTSCISIVLLTHGGGSGMVYSSDLQYSVDSIINSIMLEPKLAGKPKLFFIQACRGGGTDAGYRVSRTDSDSMFVIPSHADCFIMKSSYKGYVSFRTSKGSWMIQALCRVVKEYQDQDLLSIATRVGFEVAKEISYNPNSVQYHEMKQSVINWFTLTKYLYLNGKPLL